MFKIQIKPHIGIDKIQLGMTKDEIKKIEIESGISIEKIYFGCLRVLYDDKGLVNFIEIANPYSDLFKVFFEGIDIFNTKAEELIEFVLKFGNYDRKNNDSILGYQYIFKDIGLSFWRPNVFKEEYLDEIWFKNYSPELKEDEMKYWYFQSVSIAVDGYWG